MHLARLITAALCLISFFAAPAMADWYDAFPTTEAYLDYIGNRPMPNGFLKIHSDWTDRFNGVGHDADDWYLTQSGTIFRVPLSEPLDQTLRDNPRTQHRQISAFPELAGYDHFGDISVHEDEQVVLVPVDSGPPGADALLAVFSADEQLDLIAVVPFPGQRPIRAGGVVDDGQAGLVMVDPDGLVYSMTNAGQCRLPEHQTHQQLGGACLAVYQASWELLDTSAFRLTFLREIPLLARDGSPLGLSNMQGGAIAPSGRVAYLANGYSCGTVNRGLHAFDLATGRELARAGHAASDLFQYEYECDEGWWQDEGLSQEPEGLTIWDLDNRPNPGDIRGQLHAFVLDVQLGTDDVYFKHYSGKVFVDATRTQGDGTWQQPAPTLTEGFARAWSGSTIELLHGGIHHWGGPGLPAPIAIRAAEGVAPTVLPVLP
jgi:hypothetical protein